MSSWFSLKPVVKLSSLNNGSDFSEDISESLSLQKRTKGTTSDAELPSSELWLLESESEYDMVTSRFAVESASFKIIENNIL